MLYMKGLGVVYDLLFVGITVVRNILINEYIFGENDS